MTTLMAGQASTRGRLRLGRLPYGTYNLSFFADGETVLQDVLHVPRQGEAVVVSLNGDG